MTAGADQEDGDGRGCGLDAVILPASLELGIIVEHPRTATVTAADELTCLLLPAWEFRSLLNEHPEMAVPMLRVLIARLHGLSPHEH